MFPSIAPERCNIQLYYGSDYCLTSVNVDMYQDNLYIKQYTLFTVCPDQFNSVYLYSPISQITNLSRSALQSVHIDIPDL